ncbi:MAG: O-succinylhomoserine sulfhydrylase [Gammaproteobacteria bacterium]|nr:O-succinylhomoserine sulfhydrylase [Gammaproteobacteria bacterium]
MDEIDDWTAFGPETRGVRAGQHRTNEGENAEPVFVTSSFTFRDAAQAAARFAEEEAGNVYSRFTNPTVRNFEERLAALEGGERCVATSSGMGAILTLCLGTLRAGDHVVSSRSIFGSTRMLFNKYLTRLGIAFTYVSPTDPSQWRDAIRDDTRMLFVETPANPLTEVTDLAAISSLARERGILSVVDNCFCTPVSQRPLEMGIDIVIHSATKYLDGQGRCVGGAIVGSESLVGEDIYGVLRNGGTTMSPFNAWVFLKGLETLAIRMRAVSDRAQRIAEWLETHPAVEHVYYPGLPAHPQYELARRQQSLSGGIVSFDVKGGRAAAWKLIDATRFISITANLGDTKTTITHPATTTHSKWSPADKAEAGIGDSLVRLSVGLENVEDIQGDLRLDRL